MNSPTCESPPARDRAIEDCARACLKIADEYHAKAQELVVSNTDLANWFRGKGAAAKECATALFALKDDMDHQACFFGMVRRAFPEAPPHELWNAVIDWDEEGMRVVCGGKTVILQEEP